MKRQHPEIQKPERVCIVSGCTEKPRGKTYCNKHYLRWRKYGDPLCCNGGKRELFCGVCGSERTEYSDRSAKGGVRLRCKNCDSLKSKKRWADSADKYHQKRQERYKNNPELRLVDSARAKKWYEKNKEYAYETARKRISENPQRNLEYKRKSQKRCADALNDSYVRKILLARGLIVTNKTIDLERSGITIKRIERSMLNELAG